MGTRRDPRVELEYSTARGLVCWQFIVCLIDFGSQSSFTVGWNCRCLLVSGSVFSYLLASVSLISSL